MCQIILASESPRRSELLKKAGFCFEVTPANISEFPNKNLNINEQILDIAQRKCQAVYDKLSRSINSPFVIIAADTEVILNNQTTGKPQNKEHAFQILSSLSGTSHEVKTGIYLIKGPVKETLSHIETTTVFFKKISPEEIKRYIETGDPMDKAGAYGIQGEGRNFVDKFEGSYDNIMGLPVEPLIKMLQQWKIYAHTSSTHC